MLSTMRERTRNMASRRTNAQKNQSSSKATPPKTAFKHRDEKKDKHARTFNGPPAANPTTKGTCPRAAVRIQVFPFKAPSSMKNISRAAEWKYSTGSSSPTKTGRKQPTTSAVTSKDPRRSTATDAVKSNGPQRSTTTSATSKDRRPNASVATPKHPSRPVTTRIVTSKDPRPSKATDARALKYPRCSKAKEATYRDPRSKSTATRSKHPLQPNNIATVASEHPRSNKKATTYKGPPRSKKIHDPTQRERRSSGPVSSAIVRTVMPICYVLPSRPPLRIVLAQNKFLRSLYCFCDRYEYPCRGVEVSSRCILAGGGMLYSYLSSMQSLDAVV